ncbi:hypothetical protein CTAYLR_002543 [Chrysophaeum taylorii]|uniref:Uncharacterized protein n=1 Tax=Chrysophaeum taylorii TaxID=2483200 RepID=A0AAD7UF63_9STRA|nr:hypothetical protein CTAYLR_002543 [Chrysophaeum taylorii]
MDAAWNDDVSPYDVLGVGESASDEEIRTAYRELAKLFHPDRNFGLGEETQARTAHFLKIKKAYDTLSNEGSRRLYDGCLVARERLVRKNIYKYAVSNTPEFRDVVDEQFRDAVLDPEEDIGSDALVLCCDSCGAPSKFRCSVCDMLVCAFCALREHAKEGIPPHYPSKYSPKFRRGIASSERHSRLLKNRREEVRPWVRSDDRKAIERRAFKQAAAKKHKDPRLLTCFGWVQSPSAVHLAVWVQGNVDEVEIDVRELDRRKSSGAVAPPTSLHVKQRGYAPVVDGRALWGAVEKTDIECASFDQTHVVAFKLRKARYGERWPACFEGDAYLCRDAGDHDAHDWLLDDQRDVVLTTHVPRTARVADLEVELSAKRVKVAVAGRVPWIRHFLFDCLPDASTWCLVDVDGRRVVECTLAFSNLPPEDEVVNHLFVEEKDDLFTLAIAQVSAYLDYADSFMPESDLLPAAKGMLASMRRDRPRADRKLPLHRPFSLPDPQSEPIRQWYARTSIQDDRKWEGDNSRDDDLTVEDLPTSGGAAGPPLLIEVDRITAASASKDLFGESGREAEPISTFAWDDDGGRGTFVKVYLTVPVEHLSLDDLAVRFEADRLRVQIRAGDRRLLAFDRRLFQPVIPSKCTFKCNEAKRVVALGLRKRTKGLPWASLARDPNAPETLPQ